MPWLELLGVRLGTDGAEPVLAAPGLDAAARHRAVAALAQSGVFAPARRGAGFGDREAAQAWARRRAAPLVALLQALEGRAELVWTRDWPVQEPAAPEAPGYLRAQAARLTARRAVLEAAAREAEHLCAQLAAPALTLQQRLWEQGARVGADVCALAPWASVPALLAQAPAGWRCSGPWPPYSFAELPDV
jgi:hypothetical protein